MTPARETLAVALALTAAAGVLFVSALRLPFTAAAVPLAVAAPTLLLLLEQLVTARRRASAADADTRPPDLGRREATTIAWMLVLLVLLWALGVLAAVPAYLLLHLRVRSRERWYTAVMTAVLAWCVLYSVLVLVLDASLPQGAFLDWLLR